MSIIARTVRGGEVKLGETVRNAILHILRDLPHSVITPSNVAFVIGLCNGADSELEYLTDKKRISGMISLLNHKGLEVRLRKVAPNTWKNDGSLI